jgi:2-succinyl-5-enolpyruvyl-6-hydroxy-3-cyclohexene-1-carboxylate synthase
VNPATAFAATVADELIRCGLRDAVIAPGSRSAPLALAMWERAQPGAAPARTGGDGRGAALRLHVRVDERSAAFLALGLAKAGGRPAAVVCTSGTAAAHLHAAVIEADEACVPLLVLTADRPPELRGTGANQAIDQIKLYGGAVRWFCEAGVPEAGPGMNGYWRSLACRAWAAATGAVGGLPGPVHVNVPLREPLVPGLADPAGPPGAGWPGPLAGRPGGAPWTRAAGSPPRAHSGEKTPVAGPFTGNGEVLELAWAERGVVVCGDGCADPAAMAQLAQDAGWPLLAEPSSGARHGPNALAAYPYLLASPGFMAAHRPELIVSAGRPGLSRPQLALLRGGPGAPARHVVIAQGPGRWADPARSATDVAAAVALREEAPRRRGEWLAGWRDADAAARRAADAVLDAEPGICEPGLARELAAALPGGALLWAASSLPIRDLDQHMAPRHGLRVLASRGASGIDGLVSSAIGAALAHQAGGGGPAAALLGDLAVVHDLPGLVLGPSEPRPDLLIVVANNDGGGIFSLLEQAELGAPFERLFGTPHGSSLRELASACGLAYHSLGSPGDLAAALAGSGLRVAEARTSRQAGAALRARLRAACEAAVQAIRTRGSSRA